MTLEEIAKPGRRYEWSLDGDPIPEPVAVYDGPSMFIRLREEPKPIFDLRGKSGAKKGLHLLSAIDAASGKEVSAEVGWYGGAILYPYGLKSGDWLDLEIAWKSLERTDLKGNEKAWN